MAVKTQRDLSAVRELRRLLTMETASFGSGKVRSDHGDDEPQDVTEFIRERTRPWRESWIFPLLDRLEGKGKP